MKRIAIALLFLAALSCSGANSESGRGSREYERQFTAWDKEVTTQLKANYSWIIPDQARLKDLAKKAPQNVTFLAKELQTNMFVYQILDASDALKKEYGVLDEAGSASERQRVWLNALKKK